MIRLLALSMKFHAQSTKSSIQEKLGRHEDAERSMEAARQTVKDAKKVMFPQS